MLIKAQKKYIRSAQTKQSIKDFYENEWLPYSNDFKKRFGQTDYNAIENVLIGVHALCKRDVIEKNKIIRLLNPVSSTLDRIKFNLIRDTGLVIDESQKEDILKILNKFNFKETIAYIEDAEKDFKNNKLRPACTNARHAVDEFFRNFREVLFGNKISGVTATEHISIINNKLHLPSSEQALLKNGLYVFLSHKGGHGTTDRPSPEDVKLSINLVYILFEYFLNKYGKFLEQNSRKKVTDIDFFNFDSFFGFKK